MSQHVFLFHFGLCIALSSKPKNQRVKRALEHREPKLIENVKTAMFIRGGNTSEVVTQTLKELVCADYGCSSCPQWKGALTT